MPVSKKGLEDFEKTVWAHYRAQGRAFSWRKTKNPYRILVSEIMLQQTGVGRVKEKYPAFLKRFPTIPALASAPLSEVLKVWQGMGYNRRAKFLHGAAKKILREHRGKVPHNLSALLDLPGVGKATAGGVLAYAYGTGIPFIETNIRRVFIHHFFKRRKKVNDKDILLLVEKTLSGKDPREWYYALMDYGTHLAKTEKNPNRKSAHYTRQSTFKGSRREIRGEILRALSTQPHISEKKIKTLFPDTKHDIRSILADLTNEGFLTKKGVLYSLA